MLELINRARMNPAREGVLLDTLDTWYSRDARARKPSFFANLRAEFASYPAVPPLAFHPKLIQSSRTYSQDMVNRGFFAHISPEGLDPTARGAAAGYDAGVGENISGGGAANGDEVLANHFGFMVDYDNVDLSHPLGHRLNILTSSYSEAGVGIAGSYSNGRITQDFGSPARTYILGLAYNDSNGNGSYDAGEGLAGITVRPGSGNWYAVTSASGGFAIPVDPIETVADNVNIPIPVRTTTWTAVQGYDQTYRQQQMQAAPSLAVNLAWSGGGLASPRATSVTIKRPVKRNYRLTGTDGWYYSLSMVTSQNAKADLSSTASSGVTPVPSTPKDINGDGIGDLVFQNGTGRIGTWFLDGSGNELNFATGVGLRPGSKALYKDGLGDWKVVACADINSDGHTDLVFQNSTGRISVWFLDGSGNEVNFATGVGLRPGSKTLYSGSLGDWRVVACADINSDGHTDLVFQNSAGQISAWFLDGSGNEVNFAAGVGLRPGSKALYNGSLGDRRVVACTDVNRDGRTDLVFQNGAGQISAWFLDGSGSEVVFATGAGLRPGSKTLYIGGLGDWRLH